MVPVYATNPLVGVRYSMTMKRLFPLALAAFSVNAAELDRTGRLLEELSNAFGPSGYEADVRAIMRRELGPLTTSMETDGLGSLIAVASRSPDAPRVMMAAHMDELGMIVRFITDEGYVKFVTLGGWLDQGLINQRFWIKTRKGAVLGVTGLKTPHIMQGDERTRLRLRDEIFLDVGARSKADAAERLGIRPGDPIAPDSKFAILQGGELYLGKAWDDRVGCAVMVEVMRRLKESPARVNVYAVATVQEEIGLRGAHTASNMVKPDIGISIESGVAADYPGIKEEEAQERLGGGAGLFLHDSSMIPTLAFRDFFIDTAKAAGIPLQFNVLSGYGEDGAEMQKSFTGIPAVNVTVPTRYLHNHNGIIARADFDRAVDLIVAAIRKLDRETIAKLKRFDP